MKDFVAIDFETANQHRTSICSVGVVIVRDGKIADKFYRLIKPYPNYYSKWATVWEEIAPRLKGLPFIAHNKGSDEPCRREETLSQVAQPPASYGFRTCGVLSG